MTMTNGNTAMLLRRSASAILFAACAGCDIELPSLRDFTQKADGYSDQQTAAVAAPRQADAIRAALTHFAESNLRMIEADIVQAKKDVSEISADRATMSERVSQLSAKVFADKNAKKENALLAMLKDAELNSLAAKHAGGNFSLACNEFVSAIRNAYEQQKRKEKELAKNRETFEKTVADAKTAESRSETERREEMRVLEKKIAEKERRLRHMRTSLTASKHTKRANEREMRTHENEISRLRRSLDRLRSKKTGNVSDVHRNALAKLERADNAVENRFKDSVSAFRIADNFEKATILKLETALAEKAKSAGDRLYLLEKRKLFISSVSTGLENLGAEDLAKIRADIENALKWSVDDVKKDRNDDGMR